jgi:hypothetical protein
MHEERTRIKNTSAPCWISVEPKTGATEVWSKTKFICHILWIQEGHECNMTWEGVEHHHFL